MVMSFYLCMHVPACTSPKGKGEIEIESHCKRLERGERDRGIYESIIILYLSLDLNDVRLF